MEDSLHQGESDQNLPQAQEADDIEEIVHDEVQRAVQQALQANPMSANHRSPLAIVISGENVNVLEPEPGDDDSTQEDHGAKTKICGFPKRLVYLSVIAAAATFVGGIVTVASSHGKNDNSPQVLLTSEAPSISPTSKLTPSIVAGLLYPGQQFGDLLSAQYDAVRWMVEEDAFLVNPTQITPVLRERHALATIYFGLDGRNWTKTTNWLAATSQCEWGDFVECDENDSVTKLHLGSLGLQGSLPAEIGWLSSLEILNLRNNDIVGELPAELYTLTMLTLLDVTNNHISGSLDKKIGQLINLRSLQYAQNEIEGHIPSEIGMLSKLEQVSMQQNLLSGEIPTRISGWKSAKSINLAMNDLTGFPSEFGSLEQLESLNLFENLLNSTIPTELGRATNINNLNIHDARLYGKIPVEIMDLTALEKLIFFDNFLSGSIPVGNWPQLEELKLSGNHFNGTIPVALQKLVSLESLHLGSTDLTGRIPSEIGNLSRLRVLHIIDSQQLTYPIPTTLGRCTDLSILRLNNNSLNSTIPSQLSNIPFLGQLDLSDNKLSGSVPHSLHSRRRHLNEVRLAGNNLTDGLENLFCPAPHETLSITFEADCLSKLVCNCCNSCK